VCRGCFSTCSAFLERTISIHTFSYVVPASPGEFINQALNLVAFGGGSNRYDENGESDSSRSGPDGQQSVGWSPNSKRARYDEGYGSTGNDNVRRQAGIRRSKSYRDAVKLAILRPRKHRPFSVILETLRNELSFEFGKLTERIARRLCDEFELGEEEEEEENNSSTPDDDRSDDYMREQFAEKEMASRCQGERIDDGRRSSTDRGDRRADYMAEGLLR